MDDNKQFWERFSRHYAGFIRRSQTTYQQICKAMQSFGYGLAALLFCIAIFSVCHKTKKAARKVLKSQQTHKDELP